MEENGSIKILVAEDEKINFLYLKELLQSEKTIIMHAINGKVAVDICKANDDIDIILMDWRMPVMDGQAAAIEIKHFRPGLPIILQTAYYSASENLSFPEIFDDFIPKPIKSDVLKQKLTRYVKL